jgi:hypothetical protein
MRPAGGPRSRVRRTARALVRIIAAAQDSGTFNLGMEGTFDGTSCRCATDSAANTTTVTEKITIIN